MQQACIWAFDKGLENDMVCGWHRLVGPPICGSTVAICVVCAVRKGVIDSEGCGCAPVEPGRVFI